jgi:hypothetical protein
VTHDEQNALATREAHQLSPHTVREQINHIQELMKSCMKRGTHYDTIPGCGNKPTLLQPGAQQLALMFQWATSYGVKQTDHEDGAREYQVTCLLTSRNSGGIIGEGVGCCSTMERKYHRQVPADVYNTVLKMAKKRAFVDATLNASGASDIFTQDIEDMNLGESGGAPPASPSPAPARKSEAKAKGNDATSDDANAIARENNVMLDEVKIVKDGESAKGPWKLYGIIDAEGRKFSTFSETNYNCAVQAIEKGVPVQIEHKAGRYPDIRELVKIMHEAGDAKPKKAAPSYEPISEDDLPF